MRRAPATIVRQMTRGDTEEYIADITAIQYEAHHIEVNVKGRTGPRVTVPADLYSEMGTSDAPKIFVNNQVVIRKVEDQWIARHFLVQPAKAIAPSGGMPAGEPTLAPPTNFTAVQRGDRIDFSWTPNPNADQTEIYSSPIAGPSGSSVRIFRGGGGSFSYSVAAAASSNLITVNPGFEEGSFNGWTASPAQMSVVQSTTVASGTHAACISGSGNIFSTLTSWLYPVTANKSYTGSIDGYLVEKSLTGGGGQIALQFYDSGSILISNASTAGITSLGSWSTKTVSATAPSNAAFAAIQILADRFAVPDAFSVVAVDNAAIFGSQITTPTASFYGARAANTSNGQISPFTSFISPVVQNRPVGTPTAGHLVEDYTNALWGSSLFASGSAGSAVGWRASPSGVYGVLITASTLFSDGGVTASPAFRFVTDDDTGTAQGGSANTLAFITGGTERGRFSSTGCFGVGTGSPNQAIHLEGANVNFKFRGNTGGGSWGYLAQSNISTYLLNNAYATAADTFAADATNIGAVAAQLSRTFFRILTASPTLSAPITFLEALRIDLGNNVGIGITSASRRLDVSGTIAAATAGSGFAIKEGSNAKMGIAALNSGSVAVNTTAVAASSRIFVVKQDGATAAVSISARTAGSSFTIQSSLTTDTNNVAWMIVDPA